MMSLVLPLMGIQLLLLLVFVSGVGSTTFTITNKCNYIVWPAILPNAGAPTTSTTGFALGKNESKTITVPSSWGGRFWGRTDCSQDRSGNFSCITGDCGSGKLECFGNGSTPPATLAEFTLDGHNGLDYFDVSVVDGYNLPLLVVPSSHNCASTGCVMDLNESCPSELKVISSDGKTVGCRSACEVTGLSIYCCSGPNSTPDKCRPSLYSQFFKDACPQAYSFAYDDNGNAFTCASADYQITFCPDNNKSVPSTTTTYLSLSGNRTVITGNNSQTSSGEITQSSSRRNWALFIATIVTGVLATIFIVVMIVWRVVVMKNKLKTSEDDVDDDHIDQVPGMPMRFSYDDLRIATNNFMERIGKGGFGSVFKGVLADGTRIAVKNLNKCQGKRAFLSEVQTIGSLHHFNLVRLIGFCAENSYRLLVFEYLGNGSLDNWIFNKRQTSSLDWHTRKKIILDIAKGLAYLHEECRQTIIHLDIKPQNILLDQTFNAKIADFGLSKLIDREKSQVQLSMRGTPGYLAPEWCQQLGRITVKVDVYGFGIVLLEVVCARRIVDHSQPESAFHLLRMLQNKAEYVVENLDGFMENDREEIIRMVKIGAWCLQDNPERRPLMSTIVKVLEGVMEIDANLVYKFSHALTPSPTDSHCSNISSSALQLASVLSNPR